MQRELTYTKVGDYLYPNIEVNPQPDEPLTKFGKMRAEYLREYKGVQFLLMQGDGTLVEHCLEIQHLAEERMEQLTAQFAKKEGLSEVLQNEDPIEWVAKMNSIRDRAEEIVLQEVVYS